MAKVVRNFPVSQALQALQSFTNLAGAMGPLPTRTDSRHIVRLLASTHYPNVRRLLEFLDERDSAWPAILKTLLQQTSENQFRQTLAEIRVLSHLNKQPGVVATPTIAAKNLRHHDIDAIVGGLSAKIEIYSPSDSLGIQLFDHQIYPLFKFLDVPFGFHLELILEPLAVGNVNYAADVGTERQVENWLAKIRSDAEAWISSCSANGDSKHWDGPNKSVRLTVWIRKILEDSAERLVSYGSGTRSTDSRIIFDHGEAQQLRLSPWGKKVVEKMKKKQCGEYEQGTVRLLVIDFAGLDTSSKDFFRTTCMGIFSRIEGALRLAAADAGQPVPYDGALLSRVGDPIIFAPAIELYPEAAAALQQFASAARLTGDLVDHV